MSAPVLRICCLRFDKSAINKVSSTRGNLGALHNRLDHTITPLGVMNEKSRTPVHLPDTDVAEK